MIYHVSDSLPGPVMEVSSFGTLEVLHNVREHTPGHNPSLAPAAGGIT